MMQVLVVDDKAYESGYPRTKMLEILGEKQNINFDIITPTHDNLTRCLEKIKQYSLILIDYRFDNVQSTMFKSGASLYSLFRDSSNSVPIYLISVLVFNTDLIGDFDLFVKDQLLNDYDAFKQEVEDHEKLRNIQSLDDFKKLLKIPKEVDEEINSTLKPIFSSIKGDEQSLSEDLNIRCFRWLIGSLMHKEGLTISAEGAALMLGISLDYFETLIKKFESTEYKGIFSKTKTKRWWPCLIEDLVLDENDEEDLFSKFEFKKAASIILGAKEPKDFSECVKCNERYPDALGQLPNDRGVYHVHVACSEFNSAVKHEPFFRAYREILGD